MIVAWAGVNLAAIVLLDYRETSALEKKYNLPSNTLRSFSEKWVRVTDGVDYPYRLLEPRHPNSGQKYPVIIFLHGSGESGTDNVAQLRGLPAAFAASHLIKKHPVFWVVPQCPPVSNWEAFLSASVDGHHDGAAFADRLLETIRSRPDMDSKRIYLLGYSMGAFGAWRWLADAPVAFAAGIPIAGGASTDLAQRLTGIPIRTIHGANDEVCPVAATQNLVSAINASGGNTISVLLEDTGHRSWPELLANETHFEWLFQQHRE